MPENPGQTVLWLEGSRLAVRRPGTLPFAVELTPVAEALVVAGVIPDPLAEPAGDGRPPVLESAVLYATREDWTRVQGEFQAARGSVRFAQGADPRGRAAALARAEICKAPRR